MYKWSKCKSAEELAIESRFTFILRPFTSDSVHAVEPSDVVLSVPACTVANVVSSKVFVSL